MYGHSKHRYVHTRPNLHSCWRVCAAIAHETQTLNHCLQYQVPGGTFTLRADNSSRGRSAASGLESTLSRPITYLCRDGAGVDSSRSSDARSEKTDSSAERRLHSGGGGTRSGSCVRPRSLLWRRLPVAKVVRSGKGVG